MSWIALTSSDVLNSLSQQEQGSLTDASCTADLARIVADVMAMVRGKVAGWKPNWTMFGPNGTIPEELHDAATMIGRFQFLTHLPGTQLITQWRQQEYQDAMAQLAAAATGELVIQGAVPPIDISSNMPQKQAAVGGECYFPPYGTWGYPGWPVGNGGSPYWDGGGPYW